VCHHLLSDSRLWHFLFQIDRELAEEAHGGGCLSCGAALHRADYPRKPRGGPAELPEEYGFRFSFCCSADGCRSRRTPPSVRFLGSKVYLKVTVILLTAMRQGPTPKGFSELHRLFDVSRRTLSRWQTWWRELFPRTTFWKSARARFRSPLEDSALPIAFLSVFEAESSIDKFLLLLKFLSPITTREGALIHDL